MYRIFGTNAKTGGGVLFFSSWCTFQHRNYGIFACWANFGCFVVYLRTFWCIFSLLNRHGLCQMFYTSDIPDSILPGKTWRVRLFMQKNENIGFWSNCQSFCKFLLKYKVNPVILWKIQPEHGNFHRKFFKNLPKTEIFKCDLSRFWQIPCLLLNNVVAGWQNLAAFRRGQICKFYSVKYAIYTM